MELTEFEKRLLALHYVYPVPLSRLRKLFEKDPELERLPTLPTTQISELLAIPYTKALLLKSNLHQHFEIPYDRLYAQKEIIPIPFSHSHYPVQLRTLVDPPAVLYVKGDCTLLTNPYKIAVIGSRQATSYSKQALSLIIPPLVQHQIVIVSGLAKGADTMAHEVALHYGGKTIAVLGHGLFHLYPKQNKRLADEIGRNHLLVTEYPPYMQAAKWTFPMRNRIISGLSDAVVITESAEKSGTMSTVEHALDHGKDIFAVPGSILSPLSIGPNKLINEGAEPIWNGYQIIESLSFSH
ncbi:DNA-processing protein DprA [Sporosarcina sp. HYO08]|uniref:DNA-processing protein DprA n=1 Tax=Sporosarcina sp. HYO08 TaxID=1759557 RepID=UPI000799CE7F|nr:DNA-processing protein DprA [Sporosarcina sp. HYO08]KXH79967.1 hypothetical protein AU377_10870 [Sporosarcina sp. HYO08]